MGYGLCPLRVGRDRAINTFTFKAAIVKPEQRWAQDINQEWEKVLCIWNLRPGSNFKNDHMWSSLA